MKTIIIGGTPSSDILFEGDLEDHKVSQIVVDFRHSDIIEFKHDNIQYILNPKKISGMAIADVNA